MSRFTKTLIALFVITSSLLVPISGIQAQPEEDTGGLDLGGVTVCTFIKPICDALGIKDITDPDTPSIVLGFTQERLSQVVSLVFIGIILISVFIIVQSAVKYIQSQGEEAKIAEAQKAIRSVFVGIAVLFIGIIGLILVLAFFNASGLISNQVDLGDAVGAEELNQPTEQTENTSDQNQSETDPEAPQPTQ